MVEINTSNPVLVTGATGYVAGWIVKGLLEKGITVYAAIRDVDNKTKDSIWIRWLMSQTEI